MGRRFVVFVAVAFLGLALTACDWPQFMLGPSRTGYNTLETTVSASNVSTLVSKFSASVSTPVAPEPPVIANGVAYMDSDGELWAFDATGTNGCSGSPKTCTPLWTAPMTLGGVGVVDSSPAVVNGVVYVGGDGGILYAFDAAGTTNCSGSPTVCSPLWTADTHQSGAPGIPTVANGLVYTSSGSNVYVYDATGTTNCSGTPKVCSPLWSALANELVSGAPAVDGGYLYIPTGDGLGASVDVFDAAGSTGCSGTPKVCSPLWTDLTPDFSVFGVSVANGVVYATAQTTLYVFDARGTTNCSGVPVTCSPLWTANLHEPQSHLGSANAAIGNGIVYIAGGSTTNTQTLLAFDAKGTTNCSGTPKTCSPLWTYAGYTGDEDASLAVANGVVYTATGGGFNNVLAFDAAGNTNCSGTPKVCTPLWSATNPGNIVGSGAVLINGTLYVDSTTGLYAYGLPG